MKEVIKVFIVDDHRIVINGIRAMLEGERSIKVVGDAESGEETLEKLQQLHQKGNFPDIILVDIKLPDMNGITLSEKILEQYPNAAIVALTMFDDNQYISKMINMGAKGYILKNISKKDLIEALHKVKAGKMYFSDEVIANMAQTYSIQSRIRKGGGIIVTQAPLSTREVYLTRREKEILRLIACELTNQEIADRLSISPRTVHTHRRSLMQKLGVKNAAGLVRYALNNNIITEEEIRKIQKGEESA